MQYLDEFTAATIAAHRFADHAEEWDSDVEWSEELEERVKADCHSFWARCYFYVKATDMTPEDAGHDFALTRNGHGVGFWDGDWDHTPYAEKLDKLTKNYGQIEFYVGDDGKVYA